MRKILLMTWQDWCDGWKTVLPFSLLYRFLLTLGCIPFFGWVINFLLEGNSPLNLVDEHVIERAIQLSPILLIFVFLFFVTSYFEHYLWTLLSYQSSRHGQFNLRQACQLFCQQFPKIWPIVCIQSIINFFVAFLGGGLLASSPIQDRFQFPTFIASFIENNQWLLAIYILIFLCFIFFYFRTLFLTAVAIDCQSTFLQTWKTNMKLTKRKQIRNILLFALVQIIVAGIGITVVLLVLGLIGMLIALIPNLSLYQALMIFQSVVIVLTTLAISVWTPLQAFTIQNFYTFIQEVDTQAYVFEKTELSTRVFMWIAMVISVAILFGTSIASDFTQGMRPLIIAHRGANDAPENTRTAMERAIASGAQMLEIDVQQTKDGTIVLEHDQQLTRAFGLEKTLDKLTYDELVNYDAGEYYYGVPTDETIATLQEVIEIAQPTKTPIIIELKSYRVNQVQLIEAVNTMIVELGCEQWCYVASAHYDELEQLKSLNTNIKRLYVSYLALGDFAQLDVDGFMIENTNLTSNAVKKVKAQQKLLYTWTVNSEQEVYDAWEKGVDGIITDNIGLLQKIYEQEQYNE